MFANPSNSGSSLPLRVSWRMFSECCAGSHDQTKYVSALLCCQKRFLEVIDRGNCAPHLVDGLTLIQLCLLWWACYTRVIARRQMSSQLDALKTMPIKNDSTAWCVKDTMKKWYHSWMHQRHCWRNKLIHSLMCRLLFICEKAKMGRYGIASPSFSLRSFFGWNAKLPKSH